MPLKDITEARDFNLYSRPEVVPERPEPGLWDTFSAAFQLENTVANAAELMTRPVFQPEEGFHLRKSLQEYDVQNRTNLYQDYRDNFLGTQSRDEMLYTIQRIKQEEEQRDTLARAGWTGVVASVAAGIASPETFLPLVGPGTKLKAVAEGLALGALAGGVNEAALRANQETRSLTESVINLGASTALGGILGGTVGMLRKGEHEILERSINDFVLGNRSVGAAETVTPSAGGLASGAGVLSRINDASVVFTNPVTQTINQTEFKSWRTMMQRLSDSGLRMEGNVEGIPATVGGTVENRATAYLGNLYKGYSDLDDAYKRYFFDNDVPSFLPGVRASLGGTFNAGGKLSRQQFSEEVTKALWNGLEHEVPEVLQAAQSIDKNIYQPILKAAQEVGLMGDDVGVVGDAGYANRLYNIEAIQTRTQEFVAILAKNYEKQLQDRFTGELDSFKVRKAKKEEAIADAERPADEVAEMANKFREELNSLEESIPEDIQNLEAAISKMRATQRALREAPSLENEAMIKQLRADIRAMEKEAGEPYVKVKQTRADLRRRIRNLNQSAVALDEKRAAKVQRMEALEDNMTDSLYRVVRKAQSTLRALDRISDKKLDEELRSLRDQFEHTARLYDKGEDRIRALAEGDDDLKRVALEDAADALQSKRMDRLSDLAERIENIDQLPRDRVRDFLEAILNESVMKVQRINARRAQRAVRLQEEIKKLDPDLIRARLEAEKKVVPRMEDDFVRRWTARGLDDFDIGAGVADFSAIAQKAAREVKDTIVGTYLRLPYSEVLQKERGSELVRVLDIPSNAIADFLEKDIAKLTRVYTRTMGPDIEIVRKFGSLDWRELIQPAVEERDQLLEQITKAVDKKGEPRSQEWKERETHRINKEFELHKGNFEAVIQRLRSQRGLPADPDGLAYRAAKTVMDLNVLRMMGMVTISSFPDLAMPVMKYGLLRTFRDGYAPLVTNLKAFKLNAREAKLAGAALEPVLHARANAVRDVIDDLRRGSKFERAVEYATNRMGLVALFDFWTQGGKLMTSSIANAKLMDALAVATTGQGNMSEKAARTFLAENGIDEVMAENIWREVRENGGGGKVHGIWWPNTESWKNPENIATYRAALSRLINNTIITPGVERPLLSDANIVGRMLYQFKSFGMSATPKILGAGLQQRDAAVLSGTMAALALGTLSYYTWAIATGGRAKAEMENAGLDKWADEAIARSGLIGSISELQRVGQNIPLIAPLTSFSGTKQTRRPGDSLIEALGGPSFDFLENATGVLTGIHEPTQGTMRNFVRLLPYQNTLGLREAIDAVESTVGSQLPERRN